MSFEDPAKISANVKENNKPNLENKIRSKRDFGNAVEMFNKKRNQRDFSEMTSDIEILIRDWDDESAQSFVEQIKSAYHGWERNDFVKLLNELGVEIRMPEVVLINKEKERLEKQEELIKLEWQLKNLEDALKAQQEQGKWALLDADDYLERELNFARENKKHAEDELKAMSFFKKFSDSAKQLNANLKTYDESITELTEKIKNSPLTERQAEKEKRREEQENKLKGLEEKIKETKDKIIKINQK